MFTFVYLCLPLFNSVYLCLSLFTFVYLCSTDASMHKFCACFWYLLHGNGMGKECQLIKISPFFLTPRFLFQNWSIKQFSPFHSVWATLTLFHATYSRNVWPFVFYIGAFIFLQHILPRGEIICWDINIIWTVITCWQTGHTYLDNIIPCSMLII